MTDLNTLAQAAALEVADSKVYAKKSSAKAMATKLTKKRGVKYIVVEEGGQFAVVLESLVIKSKPASAKTNVVGRASGGAWLNQTLKFLAGKVTKETAAVEEDEKGKVWITDGEKRLFWFKLPERAFQVVASL